VPILRQNHDVPPELERIVAKAMAKRADERYQSAQDLMADLKALRRQVDSGVSQEDYVQVRRQRVWLAVVAGLVVLGIGVAALILAQRWLAPALPRSVPHQLTSAPGWEAQPALSPDGSLIAYASDEAGQPDIWLVDAHGGSTLRLTDGSAAARSPAWFPSGEAVAFVSDREGRTGIWKVSRLGGIATRLEADAEDPAISPDGTRIAFARSGPSGEMRIFVAPLSNVEDARMLTSDGAGLWNHRYPGWSPDGRTLCYSGQRDLWAVSATGGPARKLTSDDEVDTECAWSPSGRYVYFSSYREGTMAVWRVPASGGPAERVTLGGGPEVHPSLSRDGRRLAYSTFLENPDVVIHDLGTGKESRIGGLREEFSPVFCPDARAVAFVSNRLGGRFDLWWQAITPDGQPGPPRRLTDHAGSATRPTCSPDGRWVAYHRVLAGQRDIWVVPAEGGNSMQFTTDPAADVHPDWSPDGSRLAFASERGGGSHIWVQPIAGGRPAGSARAVTSGDRMDLAPAWSPDGRAIAFIGSSAGDPGSVWIVRVDEGAPARRVTVGAGAVRVRWERSSGLLLVSGHWGAPEIGIRRVNPEDGRSSEPLPAIRIAEGLVDFDVSPDGRLITFSRAEHRGDIWLLEAQAGSY
jgi:Tol biopolymer transport system component